MDQTIYGATLELDCIATSMQDINNEKPLNWTISGPDKISILEVVFLVYRGYL